MLWMNLVYVDESGNTGLNLKDSQQPVFILAAMIVPEREWFTLEENFFRIARSLLGDDLSYPFEIHATDLKSGRRLFKTMALPFVCMEVDHYLRQRGPDQLGMLIFDEQKENLDAVERSPRTLRLDSTSILKTTNIVEKGFFVDSSKSFALQLVDMAAYHIRKYEESKLGFRVNPIDVRAFVDLKRLISTGVGSDLIDVVEWVKAYFAQ
jgi:hypothetical protein